MYIIIIIIIISIIISYVVSVCLFYFVIFAFSYCI